MCYLWQTQVQWLHLFVEDVTAGITTRVTRGGTLPVSGPGFVLHQRLRIIMLHLNLLCI